jgi:lactoylglutathione lyase
MTTVDESGTCCFANQDKVWVDGPDGSWEIYTIIEDTDAFGTSSGHVAAEAVTDAATDEACCGSMPESAARCC